MTASVLRMDGCDITLPGGGVSHGVNQDWYPTYWRRTAGCGPCTASNMLRYWRERLALTLPTDSREQMVRLMEKTWGYVTPGVFGLNSPLRFQEGMDQLLQDLGSDMRCRVLLIPKAADERPALSDVAAFLQGGLEQDSPVAFLNLHNGTLSHLDRWHWITLLSVEHTEGHLVAHGVDNGKRLTVDLSEWLKSSTLGGGFVSCGPQAGEDVQGRARREEGA